jgi:hypothetical protein
MPSSSYVSEEVYIDNEDGTRTFVPLTQVKGWDVDADTDLGVIGTTDADGVLAGGTLSVSAGTTIRFRVESYHGRAGYTEQVTT